MAALKTYRTAIGFYDAYVAAPSMKAALKAWGTESNLFATGMAELVTDPKLTRAALAEPGEVIKVKRGTDAEHFAALGDAPPPKKRSAREKASKPKPRPSRSKLDAAEASLAEAEASHGEALAALARRETALREERRRLEASQKTERAELETRRTEAEAAYDDAIKAWRE